MKTKKIIYICNGEIYNFKELADQYQLKDVRNRDCFVLPLLYIKLGFKEFSKLFAHEIKGEFAFGLFKYNELDQLEQVILGRDMIGIRPLYVNKFHQMQVNDQMAENGDTGCLFDTPQESLVFSSSIKSLEFYKGEITHFEPGTLQEFTFNTSGTITNIQTERFDWIYNITPVKRPDQEYLANIRNSLIRAVEVRLNADQPICFLLSGGLDSSLVCSIAQTLLKRKIYTFCCGMSESGQLSNTNDIQNARKVAQFIGSHHTEVTFTAQQALDMIPTVIRNIGTWCQTTIRASTPMFILCKYIRDNTPFKVVFSGENADELFQGYLFNYEIPKDDQIEVSSKLMIKNVHKYDVLRADGCISQNSLESRIPFSDQDVIKSSWELPNHLKHPRYKDCEKYWLRQAFKQTDTQLIQYLPNDVLFRTKVAFSNSIADNSPKSWIQMIKDYCKSINTTELEYYESIFENEFGYNRTNITGQHWQPHRFDANGQLLSEFVDSSAEILDIYKKKFNNKQL